MELERGLEPPAPDHAPALAGQDRRGAPERAGEVGAGLEHALAPERAQRLEPELRGTLVEVIREAEHRGVAGFTSAGGDPSRVTGTRELAGIVERVQQLVPGSKDLPYVLDAQGIRNATTGRMEYLAVMPGPQRGGEGAGPDRARVGVAQVIALLAAQARSDPRVIDIMTRREQPIVDAMDGTNTAPAAPHIPQTDKAWAAAAMAVQARAANRDAAFLPAPDSLIGTPEYYVFRWAAAPAAYREDSGPEYLLDFGYANINRFNALAASEGASQPLKDFVANTGVELQRNLERALGKDPSIGDKRERLLDVAYDSHTSAYAAGGFGNLTIQDQARVANTPPYTDSFLNPKSWPVFWDSRGMVNCWITPPPALALWPAAHCKTGY